MYMTMGMTLKSFIKPLFQVHMIRVREKLRSCFDDRRIYILISILLEKSNPNQRNYSLMAISVRLRKCSKKQEIK